jgi:manganese transport protein
MHSGIRDGDPYSLSADGIEAPPATVVAALRRIGPGMVLAASIVGSGELIATTTLGAQVGFAALWIILVSCAIKPVVQGELGRYTIGTGET